MVTGTFDQGPEEVEIDLLDGKPKDSKDPERDVWSNKFEYMLGLIGYTVGLGSVWRFPYLCMKNGGGAFLVPFFIFTLLCGFPLYMIEMTVGQFSGMGAVRAWKLCPLFEGVGYAMIMLGGIVTWYYGLIVAWVLLYLFYSFYPTQPWSTCDNDWNTDQCVVLRAGNIPQSINVTGNISVLTNTTTPQGVYPTAATEFWRYKILNSSPGIDDWGTPQWHLVIALFFSYAATFLCLIKGVKSVGKVVYVTVIGPFVLLITILIRSLCLDGSMDGVMMYLKPDFSRLLYFQVWLEAGLQVFYSLGPIWGGVLTMASYHKFRGNIMRNTMIIVAVDTFSNFLCGLVVFSILGFLAHDAGLTIPEVAESGPGLVFLVYPEVLARLPLPQLWAVIFFFMLFTVGLDSQFGCLEAVIAAITEMYPKILARRKHHVLAVVYVVFFLTSLIFATQGGVYIFQYLDWYLSAFCIFLLSFLECVIAGWLYGAERLSRDFELMTGRSIPVSVRLSWCILTPFVMLVAFLGVAVGFEPPVYKGYVYPAYLSVVGIFIAMICCLPLPVVMVTKILQTPGSFKQRLKTLVSASQEWAPNDETEKEQYKKYEYTGGYWQTIKINLLGVRQ